MPHIFRNFESLATTALRHDALTIVEDGLRAVNTNRAVHRLVQRQGNSVHLGSHSFDLSRIHHLYIVGCGKAALDAATALEEILGPHISGGVVIDIRRHNLPHIETIAGTHPFPSHVNREATQKLATLLDRATKKDLVIAIISGGGSALLSWPHELEAEVVAVMTKALMHRGATIHELNTVRKHLSRIQGGQLAQLAYPAPLVGLIFSDVPGDDISMVASGPTVLDTTTVTDAERILEKYQILQTCNMLSCPLIETPKDPKFFRHVHNILTVSNTHATGAMVRTAQRLGYTASEYSTQLAGEAREVGALLARLPHPGEAFIAAGETTVTVTHPGEGGRNLEVALGALAQIRPDTLVLSCASDGKDNVPIAGALADTPLAETAKRRRMDPKQYLQNNESFTFFTTLQTFLDTGPTGINVSDLMLALHAKKS